jgi:1-acyl-sn-glycerol-3-phosphate acyltransferase
MTRWHRWRTNIIQAPLVFLATGLCGTAALIASVFAKTGRTQHRIARVWARACLAAAGGSLTIRGLENLPNPRAAVYASNHTSYMDIPVVFSSLPFQFRILAKKELWQWPFIGWYLNRSGQIPIDAENPRAALSSLGAGVKALREGMPLFVFPEGSRTPDGELKEFLAGAAFLAIRAQVPLVPIALSGVYDLLPIHTHHFYPCPMTLTIGKPIATAGLTMRQADELTNQLRAAIAVMLDAG